MGMDFDVWFAEPQAMTLDQYRRADKPRKRTVSLRSGEAASVHGRARGRSGERCG